MLSRSRSDKTLGLSSNDIRLLDPRLSEDDNGTVGRYLTRHSLESKDAEKTLYGEESAYHEGSFRQCSVKT